MATASPKIKTGSSVLRRSSIQAERRNSVQAERRNSVQTKKPKESEYERRFSVTSTCSDFDESLESEVDDVDYDDDPQDWFLEDGEEEETDEEGPMFTILEKQGLVKRMREFVESVAPQLDLSIPEATLILQHFIWNDEKLLRLYFDKPDFYKKEAGLIPAVAPTPSPTLNTVTCIVCFEAVPSANTHTAACGHKWYCKDCWREYLAEATKNSGSQIINVHCMYPKCSVKLNQEQFKSLSTAKDFERYTYFLMKNYVESDAHMTYCPSATCGRAVQFHGTGKPTDVVECHCGTRFCFNCGQEKHNPVRCEQLDSWQQRNRDDNESMKLIQATTKPCFHCGMPTERTKGCNHMTCRKEQGGCGGEWCWMCRGDWRTHGSHTGGFYSCNKYDKSNAKSTDDEAARIKAESDAFLHYFNRYFNHDVLNKHAETLRDGVETKMMEYRDYTAQNPDFLMEAADLLVECRRILKYTYVFAFYLPEGPAKTFFEYLQANAEGITERLATDVSKHVSEIDAEQLKNNIRVTKKYSNNLVKGIEEGLGVEGGLEAMRLTA